MAIQSHLQPRRLMLRGAGESVRSACFVLDHLDAAGGVMLQLVSDATQPVALHSAPTHPDADAFCFVPYLC